MFRVGKLIPEQGGATCGRSAGVSLLEVLIAVSLLGLSFGAIFPGLSSALRTSDLLDGYGRCVEYATAKLNDLALDPTLGPGEVRSGVSNSGVRWRATTGLVDKRPTSDPDRPVQLIRIRLETSWNTSRGTRSFVLQTLKLRLPEPRPNP
jgi:general secretion pathway protein I